MKVSKKYHPFLKTLWYTDSGDIMFKDEVKRLRLENNLTQEELAEKLYVSRSAVAKWDQGRDIPREDTLTDIASFFNVSKDELYKTDEPQKVIELLEKRTYRLLIILLSIITVLVIVITFLLVGTNNKLSRVEYDKFFSNEMLEYFYLKDLEPIVEDSSGSLIFGTEYCIDIENEQMFHDYVEYVFNYLQTSPYISYVGFQVFDPENKKYEYEGEVYILASNNLDDYYYRRHLTPIEVRNDISYQFFYIPTLDINRNKGDSIEFYYITLTYQKEIKSWRISKNDIYKANFTMFIDKPTDIYDYYLFHEYYDLEIVEISDENFFDYFDVNPVKIESGYMYYLIGKGHYFLSDINVSIIVDAEDKSEEAVTKLLAPNYGNTLRMKTAKIIVDNETNEKSYGYDLKANGYFYMIKK